jgi:hypothetical protein
MNKLKYIFNGLFILNICLFAQNDNDFVSDFDTDSCTFSASGQNEYFVLQPGYRLVLAGEDDGDEVQVVITVMNETKIISGIKTRVVEENESENGETKEISRNYFAICSETGDVYYFGEDVDLYKNGKIVKHSGAWIADGGNKPGIIMPGKYEAGYKYYQEIAPGIAMDRAEIIGTSVIFNTPAGEFTGCLKTRETTPLKPKEKEYKHYASGIGLIQDGKLLLVKYGYLK